ncbi:D-alanine--D-alanine ligase family protein [Gordonia sp. HS-NH1]|uniref:D-alanine--D-alanine ligase family protein n=1 Tax=Gordonia sp. HS-NH1 TaxID=1435068 RepID=UPI0006E1A788|nr:hypothetical protein [Gordonia sp. HS-NH1]
MTNHVSIVFGGPSPEHEISILTGLQCERVLRGAGAEQINPIYVDQGGRWHLVPANTEARDFTAGAPAGSRELAVQLSPEPGVWTKKGLRSQRVDLGVVMNATHGSLGEGGGFASIFELMGVPATGGSAWAGALSMDKYAFGTALRAAGIPTLPRELLTETSTHAIEGPLIVKPRFGGSSIGIEVADDIETARTLLRSSIHLRNGAVVEPYRSDLRDYNVSFRTYPAFELSEIERPLRPEVGSTIYSYEEKYLNESGLQGAPREMPAVISQKTRDAIHSYAREVADVTGITGIVRVDFLSNDDEVFVNEANTIPGAMALYLWTKVPVDRLLLDAIEEVRKNPPRSSATTTHNRSSALQAAGGIAGKLAGLNVERH